MEVLVKWTNDSLDWVQTNKLKSVNLNDEFIIGTSVKMLNNEKWRFGTILDAVCDGSSSDKNEPLCKIRTRARKQSQEINSSSDDDIALCQLRSKYLKKYSTSNIKSDESISKTEVTNTSTIPEDVKTGPSTQPDVQKFIGTDVNSGNNIITEPIALNDKDNNEEINGQAIDDDSYKGDPYSDIDLSDTNDPTYVQCCEVPNCKGEVFSSCFRCQILLCWDHFIEDLPTCDKHRNQESSDDLSGTKVGQNKRKKTDKRKPEDFNVEGASKEYEREVTKKINKKKMSKALRQSGAEYVSVNTKKTVKERKLGAGCNSEWCKKGGRSCGKFSEDIRQLIFENYYKLANIQVQREYIARHVKQVKKKCSTTTNLKSRRENTNLFFLPLAGNTVQVCRSFFMNTLNVSEKVIRTVLAKMDSSGFIEKDNRGGRSAEAALKDEAKRKLIENHISRFPRVESHYCRKDSTREYLNSDLSLKKMYAMFLGELSPNEDKPSFTTYRAVFKTKNLSFHRPKKDLCSLCKTYHEASEEKKIELQDTYDKHTKSKNAIRDIKNFCKISAQNDPQKTVCLCFDLQQVIHLPISNENAIFYKRRFACYNLTFYNLASRDCHCFTWNECDSGRGSCEISTALFETLLKYDEKKVQTVNLFADGCGGQNRNTVVAAALLFIVSKSNHITEISLRFFVTNHGQSEGDSAHSAISYAIKKAGELFVPSQLTPIIRLARHAKPYEVRTFTFDDFWDFKSFSENLRVRSLRTDDKGNPFKWTDVAEFKVTKTDIQKIFFKTSHLDENYRSVTLKRQNATLLMKPLSKLNKELRPISMAKYKDLNALCIGNTPVVRLPEHTNFYKSLPHTTE